jgi:hypothetical protein
VAAAVVDAQLRVHWPAGEPERAGRLSGGRDGGRQDRPGQLGGGDEQGFLEGGTVRHGGLVEDGGDGEPVACHQAVDADLRPWQVLLDEEGLVVRPADGGENLPDPPGHGHGGGGIVGPQDALAGAERDRLDHARKPHRLGRPADGPRRGRGGDDLEPRLRNAGGGPPLSLPHLVGGVPHCLG